MVSLVSGIVVGDVTGVRWYLWCLLVSLECWYIGASGALVSLVSFGASLVLVMSM
jgi:hypothetical protein